MWISLQCVSLWQRGRLVDNRKGRRKRKEAEVEDRNDGDNEKDGKGERQFRKTQRK